MFVDSADTCIAPSAPPTPLLSFRSVANGVQRLPHVHPRQQRHPEAAARRGRVAVLRLPRNQRFEPSAPVTAHRLPPECFQVSTFAPRTHSPLHSRNSRIAITERRISLQHPRHPIHPIRGPRTLPAGQPACLGRKGGSGPDSPDRDEGVALISRHWRPIVPAPSPTPIDSIYVTVSASEPRASIYAGGGKAREQAAMRAD